MMRVRRVNAPLGFRGATDASSSTGEKTPRERWDFDEKCVGFYDYSALVVDSPGDVQGNSSRMARTISSAISGRSRSGCSFRNLALMVPRDSRMERMMRSSAGSGPSMIVFSRLRAAAVLLQILRFVAHLLLDCHIERISNEGNVSG